MFHIKRWNHVNIKWSVCFKLFVLLNYSLSLFHELNCFFVITYWSKSRIWGYRQFEILSSQIKLNLCFNDIWYIMQLANSKICMSERNRLKIVLFNMMNKAYIPIGFLFVLGTIKIVRNYQNFRMITRQLLEKAN